ncbi:MAG: MFS transporter [Anaerolineales bacterium]|nr:MFS transporter [Anaerolineales bacterium]
MLEALTKIPRWQRTLIVLFFSQMATAVGFSSIFPFLPLYVKSLGSSTGMSVELLSGLVFSAQAFTMMLASPVWGRLADRYGRKLMIIRASFGGAIVLLMMAFAQFCRTIDCSSSLTRFDQWDRRRELCSAGFASSKRTHGLCYGHASGRAWSGRCLWTSHRWRSSPIPLATLLLSS